MAFTPWSTASMRSMQLVRSSVGASFFWPIRRRASIASRSQGSVISIAQCEAVLAWVRATDQAAARAIDPDRLAAAMRSFHRFHVVPQLRQPLADVARDAMLELHLAA